MGEAGHPRYHDREVGEAVRKAVGYWSRNKFQNSNWWWNDMFVPQKMGEILLMADPLFPEGPEREAALDVCRQAMLLHRYTGNNRVFIAANIFYRALLERNERALSVAGRGALRGDPHGAGRKQERLVVRRHPGRTAATTSTGRRSSSATTAANFSTTSPTGRISGRVPAGSLTLRNGK